MPLDLIQNLMSIASRAHPSSGYAQAFHYYLTGDFVDNLDLSFLETEDIEERLAEGNQNNIQSKEVRIFPNPASVFINITNSQYIQSLKIYNSNGILMQESTAVSKLNIKDWSNGIYIFSIEKVDGSIKTKKIIIN